MEDKSLYSSQPQGGVSEDFRQFIKETIEEVLVEGKTFDVQKRWLRRLGATEGVDCDTLERNMTDLIEVMEEWKQLKAKSGERMAKMIGKECYLTEQDVEGLLQKLAGGNRTATSFANPTKDASMMSGSQSHAAEDEYISECIKEVCINGDSLSKYQRLIEKKHGAEFYRQCEGFVDEVQRSVGKKKFTNTSVANLHYLARQIGVSNETVDIIIKHFKDMFDTDDKHRWVCKVCGYVYEGDFLPESCPICKNGKECFEAKVAKRRWVCTWCGHVYEGNFLPEDIECPNCKHGIEDFKELRRR